MREADRAGVVAQLADGLWRAKGRRSVRAHQSRARRACFGDLVQIDGSPHDWFEGRGSECTLIVYIDDATSRLVAGRFSAAETTEAYMATTRAHLAAHGRPVAHYSDRHSVFRVNRKSAEDGPTQFSRALGTLDVAVIHAGSPQAKGRVERANRTLQDRLVKEMRLRGIDGIEAANAYLPEFMAAFNGRFAVAPRNPADAHRPVLHDARELELILCEHQVRKLTRNLEIRFEGRAYQVTGQGKGYRQRGAAVTVCKGFDGAVMAVLRDGRELPTRLLSESGGPLPVEDGKTVRLRVDLAKADRWRMLSRKRLRALTMRSRTYRLIGLPRPYGSVAEATLPNGVRTCTHGTAVDRGEYLGQQCFQLFGAVLGVW